MVAFPLLALQVPPPASVKVIVWPIQAFVGPDIAEGDEITVTIRVAIQPLLMVYVIFEVPVEIPVVRPEAEPIVTFELLLDHVPPPASVNVVDKPVQIVEDPEIRGWGGQNIDCRNCKTAIRNCICNY
jgi:hypothetical protein